MSDKALWKQLLAEARKGDGNAQREVADYFAFGLKTKAGEIIVRQNFPSAFSWYQKAAINGDADALTSTADFLSEGKGCEKDLTKAVENYLLAINKGSGRAAFNLGTIFRDEGNFKRAFEYYSLANKMNGADYSFTVGICYYYGVGVPMDRNMACKHLLGVSADKQNMHTPYEIDEANYILGRSYLTGDGVRKSIEKARVFLKLANADGDHRSAAELLFIIGPGKD